MNQNEPAERGFFSPRLTRRRAVLALCLAVVADLLQIVLVPVAWTFVQAAIDVVAMLLVLPILGFHLLLLPTFVVEFMPGVDMLPTWTGCVIAVIALKRRDQEKTRPATPAIEVSEVKPAPPRLPEPPQG